MKRLIKLYDVQDIQKELEELTEDEEEMNEIKKFDPEQKDVWEIKRVIKMHFKKHFCEPPTELKMYKIGRVLGKGAYGKVNIAM